MKGTTVQNQFEQHHTEAPEIRSEIYRLPAYLFWRHVLRRAHQQFRLRMQSRSALKFDLISHALDQLRQSEIQNLYMAVVGNHDVFRLDIAMNHACLVRGGQGIANLFDDFESLCLVQRFGLQEFTKSGAFDVLHRDVMEPLDRKSTRLNSSHSQISYAVFCLKKK